MGLSLPELGSRGAAQAGGATGAGVASGSPCSCAQSAESKYFLSPPFSRLSSKPFGVGSPPYLALSCADSRTFKISVRGPT